MKKLTVLVLALIAIVGCPQGGGSADEAAPSAAPSSSALHAMTGPGAEVHSFARKPIPNWKPTPNPSWYDAPPGLRAAATSPSTPFPSSWKQPVWAFDPALTLPCTSDANTCGSTTCGAGNVGPCQHYAVAWQRWGGTYSPRLRQDTTLTWLSNQVDNTDPIYFLPYIENGAHVITQAVLSVPQQKCAGTLAAPVANFSPTPAPGVLQRATICAGATANQLIQVNNGGVLSFAWTYKLAGGAGDWNFSVPLSIDEATEQPWAVGLPYTTFAPVSVNVVRVDPTFVDASGAFDNPLIVRNMTILDPSGTGNDPVTIGSFVTLERVDVQREIIHSLSNFEETQPDSGIRNSDLEGGLLWGESVFNSIDSTSVFGTSTLEGGIVGGPSAFFELQRGMRLTADAIIAPTAAFGANTAFVVYDSNVCSAYIESGYSLAIVGVSSNKPNPPADGSCGVSRITGPGTLNVIGSSRYVYRGGAGGAAATFFVSNLKVNGQGLACLGNPAAAGGITSCNQAVTAANLDAQLGAGVTGCLFVPGGGAFCNGNP